MDNYEVLVQENLNQYKSEEREMLILTGEDRIFNVVEPKYYASNWLDFIGNLYCDIADEKYVMQDKCYTIPLTDEQRRDLFERGVPNVFITNIE